MYQSELFQVPEYADPLFSSKGRLSYLTRSDSESFVSTQRDPTSASRRLTNAGQRVAEYGWIDRETIWYLTYEKDDLHYASTNETGSGGATETPRKKSLPDDNDALLNVVPADDTSTLAVFVRDGFSYVVELYTDEQFLSPTSRFLTDQYVRLLSWDRDSNRIVAKTVENSFSHELSIYELGADTNRTISPEVGDARYSSVHWGPSDDMLYLVTDYEADKLYAATLDPDAAHPEPQPIVECTDWNVEAIGVHPSGRSLYVVNREGVSEVHVADVTDDGMIGSRRISGIPSGVVKHGAFGELGNRIAFTMSTESVPSSVFSHDIENRTTRRWIGDKIVAPSTGQADGERMSEVVRYESADGLEIPALCSRPTGGNATGTAIVDVHGGPESQRRPQYRGRIRWFLDKGYTVLEPNIRGSIGYGRRFASLDDVEGRLYAVMDVAKAGEWIHKRTDCDTVVVYGQSHGGLLALVNAYRYPEQWNGTISESGIYDLGNFIRSIEVENRSLRTAEYGTPSEHSELFSQLSPSHHADAIEVPTLVIHGKDDRKVSYEGGPELVRRIRDSGTRAELLLLEDEGHSIRNVSDRLETIRHFLDSV